jgi:glycosidase
MPTSLNDVTVAAVFDAARNGSTAEVSAPDWSEPRTVERPFPSPVDWRDHWIYFLMVDRFNNPMAAPKTQWDRYADKRQGGTFNGVRERLSYIEDLGAGAIWLTPVLKNRQEPAGGSHHGYGIMDFLEVDPRFGSDPNQAEAELIRLIDEAHARGIYVILDIVINHAGDLFAYNVNGEIKSKAAWSDAPYTIYWRDEHGAARQDWEMLPEDGSLSRDAGVWPSEFQENQWFRHKGTGGPLYGDFETLKEFETEHTDIYHDKPVWNLLIRAYQYVIAKLDVDGFRIDTLKHVERHFAITFCNAIREFALSIGKRNFFIFGETKSEDEAVLAAYTGRFTSDEAGRFGADASLDFPLQWKLGPVVKGFAPPTVVQDMFESRKQVHKEKRLLSTHGDASRFFVTFLDNHDDKHRFLYPRDGGDYTDQLTLALACLYSLQGIPCTYYGTEQGLKGTQELYESSYDPEKGKPEHVREALWGRRDGFDQGNSLYLQLQALAKLRAVEPALRYGRQYFRRVSGNNHDFGFSNDTGGVIAYSRILNNQEVVVAANTNIDTEFSGWVVVDGRLNRDETRYSVAYSNHGTTGSGTPQGGPVILHDRDGTTRAGWARRIYVRLAPMEIQILTPT